MLDGMGDSDPMEALSGSADSSQIESLSESILEAAYQPTLDESRSAGY